MRTDVPPADTVAQPAVESVEPEDAGELLTLQRAAYVSEARLYADFELPALTQTLLELQAELATSTALKAVVGHRIVGAVRARVEERVLHIGRLAVAPDRQGRGIDSRLLVAVEAAVAHGEVADTATLFTGHRSSVNLALYARHGYVEVRREPLRPGVVLVHLPKPLAPAPAAVRGAAR